MSEKTFTYNTVNFIGQNTTTKVNFVGDIVVSGKITGTTLEKEVATTDNLILLNSEKNDLTGSVLGFEGYIDALNKRALVYDIDNNYWTISRTGLTALIAHYTTGDWIDKGIPFSITNDGRLKFSNYFKFDSGTNYLTVPHILNCENIDTNSDFVLKFTATPKNFYVKNYLTQEKYKCSSEGVQEWHNYINWFSNAKNIYLKDNQQMAILDTVGSHIYDFVDTHLKIYPTTQSTSSTTGSFQCRGGVGIEKDVYIDGTLNVGIINHDNTFNSTISAGNYTLHLPNTDLLQHYIISNYLSNPVIDFDSLGNGEFTHDLTVGNDTTIGNDLKIDRNIITEGSMTLNCGSLGGTSLIYFNKNSVELGAWQNDGSLRIKGSSTYSKKLDFTGNNQYMRIDQAYHNLFSYGFTFYSTVNHKSLIIEALTGANLIANHKTETSSSRLILSYNPDPATYTSLAGNIKEFISSTSPANHLLYSKNIIANVEKIYSQKEIDRTTGGIYKKFSQNDGCVIYPNSGSTITSGDWLQKVFKIKSNNNGDSVDLTLETKNSNDNTLTPTYLRFNHFSNNGSFHWWFATEDNLDNTCNFSLNNSNLTEVMKFYEHDRIMSFKGTYANNPVQFILNNASSTGSSTLLRFMNNTNNVNMDVKMETDSSSNSFLMTSGYSSLNIASWCSVPFFKITQTGATTFNHFMPLTSGSSDLDVNFNSSTGLVYYVSSTKKDKYDIKNFDINTKKIFEKLQLKTYLRYSDKTTKNEKRRELGLCAEDFESAVKQQQSKDEKEILKYFIVYDDKNCPRGFRSGSINYLLFDRVKELQKENDQLTKDIEKLMRNQTIIMKKLGLLKKK